MFRHEGGRASYVFVSSGQHPATPRGDRSADSGVDRASVQSERLSERVKNFATQFEVLFQVSSQKYVFEW